MPGICLFSCRRSLVGIAHARHVLPENKKKNVLAHWGFGVGLEGPNNSKIITRPLDVWIKKTRDERGFGGKSLILERIPTLSHTGSIYTRGRY